MNKLENELKQSIVALLQSNRVLTNNIEQKELEKQDLLKNMALGLIETLDSFERIEEGIFEKEYHKIEEVKKVMNRYTTVQKKLLSILQQHGITKISFPDNRLIVGLCEVVDTEPDSSRKNDEIITIIRNGYIRGNELIRAAQILVVKN